MTNVIIEQELRSLYYDPGKGYQAMEKLYEKAKEKGLKISRRKVKEWLETIGKTHTRDTNLLLEGISFGKCM